MGLEGDGVGGHLQPLTRLSSPSLTFPALRCYKSSDRISLFIPTIFVLKRQKSSLSSLIVSFPDLPRGLDDRLLLPDNPGFPGEAAPQRLLPSRRVSPLSVTIFHYISLYFTIFHYISLSQCHLDEKYRNPNEKTKIINWAIN